MRIKIKVTARDISRGKVMKACSCPVALAVRRVVRRGLIPLVDMYYLDMKDRDNNNISVELPKKAGKFITRFDTREPVKPFSMVLNLPNHIVKSSLLKG